MTDSQNRPPEPPPAPENQDPRKQSEESQRNVPGVSASLQPNMQDFREIKSAQTLVMIANIAGPVSLFIGGVLLGSVGLVCGIVGYRKLSALAKKTTEVAAIASRLRRSSIIGMVICGIAIVLNAVSMYYFFPEFLAMLESGDYAGLAADAGAGAAGSATWG